MPGFYRWTHGVCYGSATVQHDGLLISEWGVASFK